MIFVFWNVQGITNKIDLLLEELMTATIDVECSLGGREKERKKKKQVNISNSGVE